MAAIHHKPTSGSKPAVPPALNGVAVPGGPRMTARRIGWKPVWTRLDPTTTWSSGPLAERCLLGFGSTAGPPTLPNYFYNNSKRIVQSEDTVVILVEMVHDARIVRMNAEHDPPRDSEMAGRLDWMVG